MASFIETTAVIISALLLASVIPSTMVLWSIMGSSVCITIAFYYLVYSG
eukprot:UN03038